MKNKRNYRKELIVSHSPNKITPHNAQIKNLVITYDLHEDVFNTCTLTALSHPNEH